MFKKIKIFAVFAVLYILTGCSAINVEKPKPTLLESSVNVLGVRLAWSSQVGLVKLPIAVKSNGKNIFIVNSNDALISFNSENGNQLWINKINTQVATGIGSENNFTSLINSSNELITLDGENKAWHQQLRAQSFTPPLIIKGRIFTLTADRSVTAFDAKSGQKIWDYQRPTESLTLRQSGVLTIVGDTLIAGFSGHLVGFNPSNGTIRWDSAIATSRGTNDIEKLIDVVGQVGRDGDIVCVRAFQAAVGCVNTTRGSVLWTKPANGFVGLDIDAKYVFGSEYDGRLVAWHRANGEHAWISDRLRYRALTAPLVVGKSIVVGDDSGEIHFLSREDGSPLARLTTDGSAIVNTPVLVAGTLIIVTKNGGIFGFKPE